MNRPRWLSFIIVFILLTFFWISLAAASSLPQTSNITYEQTIPGMIQPGNTTFGITIGAIVLVTIVITSAVFRKVKDS